MDGAPTVFHFSRMPGVTIHDILARFREEELHNPLLGDRFERLTYQITIDKASGIRKDPNDWCREHDNPSYIVDLLKGVTRVSIETMKIVNGLPGLNER